MIVAVAICIGAYGICVWSLYTGVIGIGSRFGPAAELHRSESPILYWFTWGLWTFFAVTLTYLTVLAFRQSRRAD
ncbi:MAG: hypothetical protein ACRETM_08930 [Stenotrophobium sp.]